MKSINPNLKDLYAPPICAFKNKAETMLDTGRPVLDLNQAVPDYPPPECIRRALAEAVKGESLFRYTADEGIPELREAVAEDLSRLYRNRFDKRDIMVTAGANSGFFLALSALAAPGDEIILLSPYYFNHFMAARILGVSVREVRMDPAGGFIPPREKILEAVSRRTRALVLVNPGNPTGVSYPQEVVDGLYGICRDAGIWLISDEVYNYFHADYPHPASPLNIEGALEHVVSLHSFSKTFSITGLRAGFIAAAPGLQSHILKSQDTISICAPVPGQLAALAGLRGAGAWLEDRIAEMHDRSLTFEKLFRARDLPFRILSRGAFFVYLEHEFPESGQALCERMIVRENLVMLPGSYFGSGQEITIRAALGNMNRERISDVLDALARA